MIDTQALEQQLNQGLQAIGLVLTDVQQNALINYLELLNKWNHVYNLTAIRNIDQMLVYHILDTLVAIPLLNNALKKNHLGNKPIRILDVGSGGGLPGIPWAIACPKWQLSLIDIVQKKTAFLLQAKIQLNIKNLYIITGHVEHLSDYVNDTCFDVLVCRAFSNLNQFLHIAEPWLHPKGLAVVFKGVYPKKELQTLSHNWQIHEIHAIAIPGLDVQRHIILFHQITKSQ